MNKSPDRAGRFRLEDVAESSPVEIPGSSGSSSGLAKSAPPGKVYDSLIPTVMDESEALSNSITSSRSSLIERHKQAAGGGLGSYNSYGGLEDRSHHHKNKSVNTIADEFEDIKEKNLAKRLEHTTTDFQTFSHILKGNIGTGLLALPYAVKNSGYIIGPVGLLVMGIIATHCMVVLVKVANALCKRNNLTCLNYAEAAEVAAGEYTTSPRVVKAVGVTVNIFLMITQFGFCCVYFVFMADSFKQVFCTAFDVQLDQRVWVVIILLPVIVLCWIKNLEELSPFSLIANLCILFSMAVILYAVVASIVTDDVREKAAVYDPHKRLNRFGNVQTIALFFGGVVYAFEGIGMVLPLENKMKNPHHAKPVIYTAMIIVTVLYTVFGTVGYLVYGNDIKSSITLNLISQDVPVAIVFAIAKFFYAYAIFASYMLQFYVPMDFLEPALYSRIKLDLLPYWFPRHHKTVALLVQMLFRTIIVTFTAIIAVAVPDLGDLISLIGAFASSALAFIFPALLDFLTFTPSMNEWQQLFQDRKVWKPIATVLWAVKDLAIVALGVIGLILGTYAAIAGIVANFTKHSDGGCIPLWRWH